jgi:DNA mismatch endonuclease (patch repair protein)
MRGNRSSGTKPELRLAAALRRAGLATEPGDHKLPGRPDFVMPTRLCVFVHGCFWHLCPRHFRIPKARGAGEGWVEKFDRNRRRDARVRRQLRRLGYRTAVVWEHDLRDEEAADRAAQRILRIMERRLSR